MFSPIARITAATADVPPRLEPAVITLKGLLDSQSSLSVPKAVKVSLCSTCIQISLFCDYPIWHKPLRV